jgi:adenylosuccinate synthase
VPVAQSDFHHAVPVYEDLPGWSEDITGVRRFEDLPQAAQDYVTTLEGMMRVPISVTGVGPSRDAVVVRRDLLD